MRQYLCADSALYCAMAIQLIYPMIHPKYVHDDVILDPKIFNNSIILLIYWFIKM